MRNVNRVGLMGSAALTAVAAVSFAAPLTFARPAATMPPAKVKALFVSRCGVCHRLKAAGTVGMLGTDLDKFRPILTQKQLARATAVGGKAVMTKAQLAKWPNRMNGYAGTLTSAEINALAAYMYASIKH